MPLDRSIVDLRGRLDGSHGEPGITIMVGTLPVGFVRTSAHIPAELYFLKCRFDDFRGAGLALAPDDRPLVFRVEHFRRRQNIDQMMLQMSRSQDNAITQALSASLIDVPFYTLRSWTDPQEQTLCFEQSIPAIIVTDEVWAWLIDHDDVEPL